MRAKQDAAVAAAAAAVAAPFPELLAEAARPAERRLQEMAADPAAHLGPGALSVAMADALAAGGKRLRPALVLETARLFANAAAPAARRGLPSPPPALAPAAAPAAALRAACALEMVHSFSLVHDDLPAMDDAAERRGRPSLHRAHGEATALLAGDALLALAFTELLVGDRAGGGASAGEAAASNTAAPERLLFVLAQAASRMIEGQAMELAEPPATPEAWAATAARKTGALFAAACELGALAGGVPNTAAYRALSDFGLKAGICYQLRDDLADLGSASSVGATESGGASGAAGADAGGAKEEAANFAALFGAKAAQRALVRETGRARKLLKPLPPAPFHHAFLNWLQDPPEG